MCSSRDRSHIHFLIHALENTMVRHRSVVAFIMLVMGSIPTSCFAGNGNNETYVNQLGMEFVFIRASAFMMGSPAHELGRNPDEVQHKVKLTKSFYMQRSEVTQGLWFRVMGMNPSHFQDCGNDCPVEFISWNDCQEFLKRLNEQEGGNKYRLPTETEWEYACRAENASAFANGTITQIGCGYDKNLDAMGWYCGNSGKKPHPVAEKMPNAFGLYDMHGNVWEWVQDWYDEYPLEDVSDPRGPASGSSRVLRGGGWHEDTEGCRSAVRLGRPPDSRAGTLGFRVVRDP